MSSIPTANVGCTWRLERVYIPAWEVRWRVLRRPLLSRCWRGTRRRYPSARTIRHLPAREARSTVSALVGCPRFSIEDKSDCVEANALIPRLGDRDSRGLASSGVPLIQDGKRIGVCHADRASHRFRRPLSAEPPRAATKDGAQARRLLALAAIYDGASGTGAARIGGVTLQIVRDWVMKFNAAGPDGLLDRKAPGQPSLLNATHRAALVEAIERGPIPAAHGVVRWRIIDLAQMLWDDFALSVSRPTLSCELCALGYRKLSARPRHHAQDPDAIEAFKKGALLPSWTRSEPPSRAARR